MSQILLLLCYTVNILLNLPLNVNFLLFIFVLYLQVSCQVTFPSEWRIFFSITFIAGLLLINFPHFVCLKMSLFRIHFLWQLFSWSIRNIILQCSGFYSFFWNASYHFIDVSLKFSSELAYHCTSSPSDCCLCVLFSAIVVWHSWVQFICSHPVWGS